MKNNKLTPRDMILISLFAALIAVGAYISIPLPTVPMTLQFLFCALSGILLGSRLGAYSVGLYILIGLIGFPVYANGGSGLSSIIHPTFGYIIGFLFASFTIGKIVEKNGGKTIKNIFIATTIGLAVVYLFGLPYFYVVSNWIIGSPIGVYSLMVYCFAVFILGDLISCLLASIIGKRMIPLIKM